MNNERKEIIQLNGLTILVGMAIIANCLLAGFLYRNHTNEVFIENKKRNQEMLMLDTEERQIKVEIVKLEGAPNWNETSYMHNLDIAK
jgi:hypothetical protein